MSFSTNGGGGRGSRSRRGGASLSEINVTPFVDVVLVLLIIFMLTAHVMEVGIEVDVPTTRTVEKPAQDMPVVTITKDGVFKLNTDDVNIHSLGATIKQRYPQGEGRLCPRGQGDHLGPDRAGDGGVGRGGLSGEHGDAARGFYKGSQVGERR